MIDKARKILCACAAVFFIVAAAGCPDYAHQRPVPDYENMTDDGGGDGTELDEDL